MFFKSLLFLEIILYVVWTTEIEDININIIKKHKEFKQKKTTFQLDLNSPYLNLSFSVFNKKKT